MRQRLGLNEKSFVVEVASNDGYLLQYLVRHRVPVLGIEPAANVAKVAVAKGVPTLARFFGTELANELAGQGNSADLIIGNNVLAQVPDLNDFVEGLKFTGGFRYTWDHRYLASRSVVAARRPPCGPATSRTTM